MTQNSLLLLSLVLGTYVLASIPFSLIASRIRGVDLRRMGSGNIGATNVYRTMGPLYGIVVLALDALKGGLPTYMALMLFANPWVHVLVGAVAIVGHSLSCFVKFKGGKGVATGLGVIMALGPMIAIGILCLAATLIYLTRYVAPTSIMCSILAPILFYVFGYPFAYVTMLSGVCVFIMIRHRSNIVRLIHGKENKL